MVERRGQAAEEQKATQAIYDARKKEITVIAAFLLLSYFVALVPVTSVITLHIIVVYTP